MGSFRARLGLGGKWAIAGVVAACLGVYLLGMYVVVAASGEASGSGLGILGGATLVIGVVLAGAKIPPRSRNLRLELDAADVEPGGIVTGTLVNHAPGRPVRVAVVSRGLTVPYGSTVKDARRDRVEADIDSDLAEQRFEIGLPADARASTKKGFDTVEWLVVAEEIGDETRDRVTVLPIKVRT